jgi:hypothetical protein
MTRIYPFQKTARWLSLGFLVAALLLGGWATAWAQEDQGKPKPKPVDQLKEAREFDKLDNETNEKKVEALSPHHAMLHKLVGYWAAQTRLYPEPGGDPVDSSGAVTNALILGGRALKTNYKGSYMGETFVGFGLDGYDMDKGHHFSIWMDSISTGATYDSGDCSHDGMDVVTLHGDFKDPQTGERVERKTILTLRSTSRYTYEEWHTRGEGEPTLAMQVIYSKQR